MKTKGEAAEGYRRHVCSVKRRTDSRVNEIVLNVGKEHVERARKLESDCIEICAIASYIPRENGYAYGMNRNIRKAIITMLLHSGGPANPCAECL